MLPIQIDQALVTKQPDFIEVPHTLWFRLPLRPIRPEALGPEKCAEKYFLRDVFIQAVVQGAADAPAQSQPQVAADRPQPASSRVVERRPFGIMLAELSEGIFQQLDYFDQSTLRQLTIL